MARMFNPPHPGAVLRDDVLPGLGMTVTDAADRLGVPANALTRVLAGREPVTPDLATRIEGWLGVERGGAARLWLAEQADYDSWQAMRRLRRALSRDDGDAVQAAALELARLHGVDVALTDDGGLLASDFFCIARAAGAALRITPDRPYPVAVEPGTDSTAWGVVVPDLPGCFSAGDDLEDALAQAGEAISAWMVTVSETGQPVPPPTTPAEHPEYAGWRWEWVHPA
jgi:addiction module HigA family antidote